MQVDGEPWVQPAGQVVVLRSALKVRENSHRTLNRPFQDNCVTTLLQGKLIKFGKVLVHEGVYCFAYCGTMEMITEKEAC